MATLAAVKAYLSKRCGHRIVGISRPPGGRLCALCGSFGAELMTEGVGPGRVGCPVHQPVCGDFRGCELRAADRTAHVNRREAVFEQYVAGLEIPEEVGGA